MDDCVWQDTRVSACRTHHLRNGRPLYSKRFLSVLPFHAPGLAPVRSNDKSWHINIRGEAAYSRVFKDTFGFYENLAAVNDGCGWFHIHPDGAPAYTDRFSWCGNFQGGLCVVCENTRYHHICPDGRTPYFETYSYAGDFREGRAVVKGDDGLCGHILADGAPAHSYRYRSLGVYHKGYACAQDENGWMHIDQKGMPIYNNRYSLVEPFYNGRALVGTFHDEALVIDEFGDIVVTMQNSVFPTSEYNASEQYRRFHELSSDIVGYWKTFAIVSAVKLDVPGKLPIAEASMAVHFGKSAANMKLLLKALEKLNITTNTAGVWRLTQKGSLLLTECEGSFADTVAVWGEFAAGGSDVWTDAISRKTGTDFFSMISQDASKVEKIQKMLSAYAKNDYEYLADTLPLGGVQHLIDAGGGDGTVARMITKKWQRLNVTILERADVLSVFDDRKNCDRRIKKLSTDIFSNWQVMADAVLLARVLHDWNDEKATLILAKANQALSIGGKLFIVEAVGETPDAMASLHLLTVGGGRERTRKEYQELMTEAGFLFVEYHCMNPSASLLVGEKVK